MWIKKNLSPPPTLLQFGHSDFLWVKYKLQPSKAKIKEYLRLVSQTLEIALTTAE